MALCLGAGGHGKRDHRGVHTGHRGAGRTRNDPPRSSCRARGRVHGRRSSALSLCLPGNVYCSAPCKGRGRVGIDGHSSDRSKDLENRPFRGEKVGSDRSTFALDHPDVLCVRTWHIHARKRRPLFGGGRLHVCRCDHSTV